MWATRPHLKKGRMMPRKGTVLKSATTTYKVYESLGGGGAGEVYLIKDDVQISYAAKILRTGLNSQKLKRFKNELMFGFRENHPNLIKVLDFGLSEANESFYVMPLSSETLRTMLKKGIPEGSRLPLFAQLLDGVEAAHLKGVFHRDLKPENILIESQQVKVADFGIAHFEEDFLHTQVETLPSDRLANFEYAAPEQRRIGTVDLRADIYSLGLILAEMFTGEVPHGIGGVKIADRSPNFSYLDELVNRMRQQDPAQRPQTIKAIKAELITRQNQFVELQKLDRLRNNVIRDSQVTDPLVTEPPSLVNVTFTGSALSFQLSKAVTMKWIGTFQNMPAGGLLGYGPEYHTFQGDTAHLRSTDRLAQQLIDQFKGYLQMANELYGRTVAQEEQTRVEREKRALASQIEHEEIRARVQSALKW